MSEPPAPPAGEESALVRRLKAGDESAYEELVREHSARMLAVARRMLRGEDEAQDAVQEAFLSAFRAVDRFEEQARLGTWLHRITVNAALMRLRRKRRKPEESIEDLLPGFLEDGHHAVTPAAWKDASQALETRQAREQVREAIDALPDGYRNVLMLRDIEELDTKEVADILGLSTNAVKTRLHRARVALRHQIDPVFREDGP